MGEAVGSLLRSALAHGTDRGSGRIVDEVEEDGRVRAASSRSWPHAEALKNLAEETMRETGDYRGEITAILSRLMDKYCPDRLSSEWTDHLSDADAPMSATMPASTLYHLMSALAELRRLR